MIPIRDANPTHRWPLLTIMIILANVFLFAIHWNEDPETFQESIFVMGLIPAEWIHSGFPLDKVLSSMFMHGSWSHLLMNMWYLWIFSDNVEDRLGLWRYVLLYLLSGIGAVGLHVALEPESEVPLVGASGAISGILGAYTVFFPRAQVLVWWPPLWLSQWPASFYIWGWFILQLVNGSFSSLVGTAEGGGIAFWAHVGGFLVGWALAKLWQNTQQETIL